jgi:hypothetical protein
MTNPAPRPALRKAEDSSVHPAAPVRPSRTRSRAAAVPAQPTSSPVEAPPTGPTGPDVVSADAGSTARQDKPRQDRKREDKTRPRAAKASKDRAFSGATSDHLRPDAVAAAAETAAGKKIKQPQPPTKRKKQAWTDVDLMRGKTVALDVQVPKRLRKAARDEAKRRGLDLDAVTTELLHRWLTGR